MMKVKDVASPKNSLIQKIGQLVDSSKRKELGLFLIEGPKLIDEALSKKVALVDVVVSKSSFDQERQRTALTGLDTVTVVEDKVFNRLCTTASSCGILAIAKAQHHSLEDLLKNENGVIAFGESIQDPGNLGTIIRTALAFEASGLILSCGSADFLSPKVVRGSMGAVFSLPIVPEQEVEQCLVRLKANKRRIIALDAKAAQRFDSEREEGALVYLFGNEGQGLSPQALKQADRIVSIAISPESESLNVGVAMGIVLYHAWRAQGAGGLTAR